MADEKPAITLEDGIAEVLSLLPMIKESEPLEEIATSMHIDLGAITGNRKALYRAITNYINSDVFDALEDNGTAHIMAAKDVLRGHLKLDPKEDPEPEKPEVKEEDEEEEKAFHDAVQVQLKQVKQGKASSLAQIVPKFTIFKISGQIGTPGQKDKLSYSSLSFQIQSGVERGFAESEICAAVIRAITPGIALRTYLEGMRKLDLENLMPTLRAHFRAKDATSVFNELSTATQLGSEGELEFMMRLMGLRDRILVLSKEEKGQYTLPLLQTQFLKSLFSGLKNNSIRHQLSIRHEHKPSLKTKTITDQQLLADLSEVVMNEQDHISKVGSKKTGVAVIQKETEAPTKTKEKINPLLAEIKKLTASMSGIREDVESLKRGTGQFPQQQQQQPPAFPVSQQQHPQNFQQHSQLSATTPAFQQQFGHPQNGYQPGFPPGYGRVYQGAYHGSGGFRGGNNDGRQVRKRPPLRCENCKKNNNPAFCNHCFLCCAVGHRRLNCPHRDDPNYNVKAALDQKTPN